MVNICPSIHKVARAKEPLIYSHAARESHSRAVCCVANPRHSPAMPAVCALHPIPSVSPRARGE